MAADCITRIVSLLQDDSVLAFVIPVLYNVCLDYGKPNRLDPLPSWIRGLLAD